MSARFVLCTALAACGAPTIGAPARGGPAGGARTPDAPTTPVSPPSPPMAAAPADLPRGTLSRGVLTVVWEGTHGASGLPTATLLALDLASGGRLARETWVARPDESGSAASALERLATGAGVDPATLRTGAPCAAAGEAAWTCGAHRVTVARAEPHGGADAGHAACPEGARPLAITVSLDGTPLPAPVRVDATCAVGATPAAVQDDASGAAVVVLREQVPRHEGVGTAWAFALRAGRGAVAP